MGSFHEVLPGNLVFFHFYYTGTIEIEYLDQTIALYRKNYISTENFTAGIENLPQAFCDQIVVHVLKKCPGFFNVESIYLVHLYVLFKNSLMQMSEKTRHFFSIVVMESVSNFNRNLT